MTAAMSEEELDIRPAWLEDTLQDAMRREAQS